MTRRAVVTGMGVVSPLGSDLDAFWRAVRAGASAVRPITRFDPSGFPTRIAAEVPALDLSDLAGSREGWGERGAIARYAAVAAARALAHSGLPAGAEARRRTGVVLAAGLGTYGHQEVFASCAAGIAEKGAAFDGAAFAAALRRLQEPRAAERRSPAATAAALARDHRLGGPAMAVMTACAAGTQAIGDALRWVRLGRADAVLCVASDSELYPMGLASFCLLGALSTRNGEPERASRPFDAGRDGFVLGEGAGALVLEEEASARARGATVHAEVAGFGSACDAFRVTDPHPEGTGALRAMERALADAGLGPRDVGYVNAHGTGTPANDRIEALALRRLFGERTRRVPVSSTKSMIGHLTVAAGAVEAIVTALALRDGVLPPTLNQEAPDPECDLDTVPNVAREARVETALSNSFAFGGQTACLVLRRAAA